MLEALWLISIFCCMHAAFDSVYNVKKPPPLNDSCIPSRHLKFMKFQEYQHNNMVFIANKYRHTENGLQSSTSRQLDAINSRKEAYALLGSTTQIDRIFVATIVYYFFTSRSQHYKFCWVVCRAIQSIVFVAYAHTCNIRSVVCVCRQLEMNNFAVR